jgi:hypothetical protein
MPPSVIGQIAGEARVKRLVLSHRMLRTLGKEKETQAEIGKKFSGPVEFANDLDCFAVGWGGVAQGVVGYGRGRSAMEDSLRSRGRAEARPYNWVP